MDYVKTINPTITISASPDYSAGDVVGSILTLTGASPSNKVSELRSLSLQDAAGQTPALTVLFFNATPTGGTYTDNSAIVWASGDIAKHIGTVQILAADWRTLGSKSFVTIGDIGQIHDASGDDVFCVILADGAYNAAATTDLRAAFNYLLRG